jgi:hypothetical protein
VSSCSNTLSAVDGQRSSREHGLDLLPRRDELVAGDGVLEGGYGHAGRDALAAITLRLVVESRELLSLS